MQLFLFFIFHRLVKLRKNLTSWAVKSDCTRESLDALLGHLREYLLELPKDSRTLRKTPRGFDCIEKCVGQYKYFGIQKYIKQVTTHGKLKSGINDMFFDFDGLTLFKSSSCQLWTKL